MTDRLRRLDARAVIPAVPFHVFCHDEWQRMYQIKPPWGKKDFAILAYASKRFDDPEAAKAAWMAYLANEEPFFKGHSPSKFLLEIGRFATSAKPKPRKQEDGELVSKLTRMARISAEVDRDPSIPEAERKNEYKRRWGMER